MAPSTEKAFKHYLGLAENRIASHMEHKDETSMRLAAFAVGRVVGFYNGHGMPSEWSAAIDVLQLKCYDTIGGC